MAWLKSILKKNDDPAVAVAEIEEQREAPRPVLPTGPQLAVLVPDIAGISSFRLRLFQDAAEAEAHIAGLHQEIRRGAHAFWALHDPPLSSENAQTETLVLIRANQHSELVYVVSFLDIESAHSFTRFEVRRGLGLENVLIYWAALAQVREEISGVTILPRTAPRTERGGYTSARNETALVEPAAETITESLAPPLPRRKTPPTPETPVEAEARAAVERYLKREDGTPRDPTSDAVVSRSEPDAAQPAKLEPELIAEQHVLTPEPGVEPSGDAIEEISQEPTIAAEPIAEPMQPEAAAEVDPVPVYVEQELDSEPELVGAASLEPAPVPDLTIDIDNDFFTEQPDEQAAIEEAIVISHTLVPEPESPASIEAKIPQASLYKEGVDAGMLDAAGVQNVTSLPTIASEIGLAEASLTSAAPPELESEPAIDTEIIVVPGDEERDSHLWPQALRSIDQDTGSAEGLLPTPSYDAFDIAYEVERLRNRRHLDKREGPFDGFKSPPGRF